MTAPRTSRSLRAALMLGGGIAALAMTPGQAAAQAFNGTPGTAGGSVTHDRTTPGIETVTVNTPQAVVNWTGASNNFLPSGNTVTFQGAAGDANFAILNRIFPTLGGAVTLDGNVISRISATNAARGGTVAFYTPTGLIIGANARFDVGSLILTTLDPLFNTTGQFISPSGAITFQANPNFAGSTITTIAGSQINANSENSYVIFAAPGITHGGSVRVNGSAAYVAMGAGTVSHNAGLFDIVVDQGTTLATPLVHTGSTTGPASTGAADAHNIVMTAVSDQQAIQALISGTIGYDAPLSASVENGAIVISAQVRNSAPDANETATITIDGGTYTSDLTAQSSHVATVSGAASFSQDLTLAGPRSASVTANGTVITVGGNLNVTSDSAVAQYADENRTGGLSTISATGGGRIQVAGNASVSADGFGVYGLRSGILGNGTGGTARVEADTGTISVAGNLAVTANGAAQDLGALPPVTEGGVGTGGNAVVAVGTGTVTVGGTFTGSATGTGASTQGNPAGSNGTGGSIAIQVGNTGSLTVTGATVLAVTGTGGQVLNSGGSGTGGIGQGGGVDILINGGQAALNGGVQIDARGVGGNALNGGAGIGGNVTIQAANGGVLQSPLANGVDATGIGGDAAAATGNGGAGTGGNVSVRALGLGPGSTMTMGPLTVRARGVGGAGGNGSGGSLGGPPGNGGDATGGTIIVGSDSGGGQLTTGLLVADAGAQGGAGGLGTAGGPRGDGGNGQGGTVSAGIVNGDGDGNNGQTTFSGAQLGASGAGGAGGNAGDGTGGTATLVNRGGLLTVNGTAQINALGTGGAGDINGGNAQGGTAELVAGSGSTTRVTNGVTADAGAVGGNIGATGTTAGGAVGGLAKLEVADTGTTVTVTGPVTLTANGSGGFATAPGGSAQRGGNGTGGEALIDVTGGAVATATGGAILYADGRGGLAETAGAGSGGRAAITTVEDGSRAAFAYAHVRADGQAAALGPLTNPAVTGASTGGRAEIIAGVGGSVEIGAVPVPGFAESAVVSAQALRGAAQSGGPGPLSQGGTASIRTGGGTILLAGGARLLANAQGTNGSGVAGGGSAAGGTAEVAADEGGLVTLDGPVWIAANGEGGNGAGAGLGGNGQGGNATLSAGGGAVALNNGSSQILANGAGGSGGTGGVGTGGTAGVFSGGTGGSIVGAGTIALSADGTGGGGVDAGGRGVGGTAEIGTEATIRLGNISASANGRSAGGTAPGATSAAAQGGTVTIEVADGGVIETTGAGANLFTALGLGAASATALTHVGGTVNVNVLAGGRLGLTGATRIDTGAGIGSGGLQADATGNAGNVTVANAGTASFETFEVSANSNDQVGQGTGGTVTVGGAGTTTYRSADIQAFGRGPNPNAGGIVLNNLTGAAGTSSLTARTHGPLTATNVTAAQAVNLSTTTGPLTATNVTAGTALTARTESGAMVVNGANGGTASLTSATGNIDATGLTTTGNALVQSDAGNVAVTNLNAGGTATVAATAGSVTATGVRAGTFIANAGGTLTASDSVSTGNTTLTSGGTLTATDVVAGQALTASTTTAALNATNVSAGTSATLGTTSGALGVNGLQAGSAALSTTTGNLTATNVTTTGAATLTSTNGAIVANTLTAGAATLTTSGAVTATRVRGGGLTANAGTTLGVEDVDVTGNVALTAGTTLTATDVAAGQAVAANTTTGALTATNVRAGTAATLGTTTGALTANGLQAGSAALSTTTGTLTATNVTTTGAANLTSTSGAIVASTLTAGSATLTTGGSVAATRVRGGGLTANAGTTLGANDVDVTGNVALTAGTTLTATDVAAGQAVTANTTTGALNATNVRGGTAVNLTTTSGALTAAAINAPAIALTTGSGALSGTNLVAGQTLAATSTSGAVTVNGASAGQSINLATGATATLAGTVTAPAVEIASGDIAIPTDALVGAAGGTVTLRVRPRITPTQAVFGGAAQGPGYTLDAAEANRIRAATLTLVAPALGNAPGRAPDLLMRGVTLSGANITNLRLTTPGIIQVEGALLLANAGAGHTITLDGGSPAERIQVLTPGSVRLLDASGVAAGTLVIDARDIWVGDQALFGQLMANRDFAGRNGALLTPAGPFAPRGYLEGGNVTLRPTDGLFVRNSGTIGAFGGITVSGTLTIVGGGPDGPADVVAFGRRIGPDGEVIGFPFFFQVNYDGTFTDRAEFNTCIINPRFCPGAGGIDPDPDAPFDPDGDGIPNLPPSFAGDDLISDAALTEPLIEEPVTSGGDSSAWTEIDEDEDEEEEEGDIVSPVPVTSGSTGSPRR